MKNAKVGIGVITNEEIDEYGMAKCRRLIFHRALDELEKILDLPIEDIVTKIIVDGTLFDPYKNINFECIPKADAIFPCCSAASIIAKHYRDTKILEICAEYEDYAKKYDWIKNKGYPAPKHLKALQDYGTTKFHRLSYGPCAKAQLLTI